MHHRVACRCGAVAFEIDGVQADDRQDGSTHPAGAPASTASSKDASAGLPPAHAGFGSVLWAVPRARIRMRPPEPAIGAFTYSGWLVGHRFCTTCGMHLFGEEIVEEAAAGALPMAYVNRECLEASTEQANDLSDDSSDSSSFGADDATAGDGGGTGRRRLEPAPSE